MTVGVMYCPVGSCVPDVAGAPFANAGVGAMCCCVWPLASIASSTAGAITPSLNNFLIVCEFIVTFS